MKRDQLIDLQLNDVWEDKFLTDNLQTTYNTITNFDINSKFWLTNKEANSIILWIKKYCHNLLNKQLNYEYDVSIEYLEEQVSEVITHNSLILVNEYRNIQTLTDLRLGSDVVSHTTNPYRKQNGTNNPLINNQQFNQNYFDIMDKQRKQTNGAHTILKAIYDELKLMTVRYY